MKKLRVVQLTTDNRWPYQQYDKPAPWFGAAPEALLSGFAAFPDEVDIHVVSTIRQPVKSPAKLADNIWFHSVHVPKIGWMRTAYAGCIWKTRQYLKTLQPDLVHGQGTEMDAAICASLSGYPNVITLLGVMKEMVRVLNSRPGNYYWLASQLESFALRRSLGVLANSRFTEEKVQGRTPKTWLVANAVRDKFFDTPLPDSRPGKCILINAGTVCTYKRQNELIDVTDRLHAEGLPFELHFLGAATNANAYGAKFLSRVKNSSYLFHHGHKNIDEFIRTVDGATAIVHVSAIESFGLVVAESLSRNLKFIGFNTAGVADIVEGVEGAESLRDGDWSGLKQSLAAWIRAGHPRPTTAAATMKQRFHPREIARQHLEVYREVLGRK
ncbi:MAG: glycosyltransferase family 4 protein [Verrucomicrobiota bacterium]